MAFSTCTITHTFQNADGTPASGVVKFTLESVMTNGSTSVLPGVASSPLNSSGQLSQVVTANNDPGTSPANVQWRVDIDILGAPAQTYAITVPTGGGTVELGSLLPGNQQVA